jgi:hypothetical protein
MSVSQLSANAAPVIQVLYASGFSDAARDLEASVLLAASGDSAALARVEGLCSVKALGDLNVEVPLGHEWWNMLSRLRSAAKELALRKH